MRFFQVGPWDQHSGVRGNVAKGMVDLVMCIMLWVVSEALEPNWPAGSTSTAFLRALGNCPLHLLHGLFINSIAYPSN